MSITIVNLGYVSKKSDCLGFLYNMFSDKYICNTANSIKRHLFATLMLSRLPSTCKILKKTPSPLYKITKSQAEKLSKKIGIEIDFCFSYSKPKCNFKNTHLMPLYTTYSKTLYGKLFDKKPLCITPPLCTFKDFINFYIEKLDEVINKEKPEAIVFSNHSLPVYLAKNDTYEKDSYIFCNTLAKNLNLREYFIGFQSKLGPIQWLKPTTIDILNSLKGKKVLIVPVSFISDNTETLYEIDYKYKEACKNLNIDLKRFSCFNDDDDFIDVLGKIALRCL